MVAFHSPNISAWLCQRLDVRPGGWGEAVKLVAVDVIGKAQANALPTSDAFYLQIPTEHILLIQGDAIALRSVYLPGPATSPALLQWMEEVVYMVAPWIGWCSWGGNGSCSCRRWSIHLSFFNEDPLECEEGAALAVKYSKSTFCTMRTSGWRCCSRGTATN